jgi:cytochrome P450
MATATTQPIRLPPGPRLPKTVQGILWRIVLRGAVAAQDRRYGSAFTLNLPVFGRTVMISDPVLVKDLFSTGRDLLGRPKKNLSEVMGPGSLFSLEGDELLNRRKLLLPPFHGSRMRSYHDVIEEEVMREIATWPEGREFETLEPMRRIALNVMLRALFGAEGSALEELRRLFPPAIALGSRIALMPPIVRGDFGRWSPWRRYLQYRRRIDAVIDSLIAEVRTDPAPQERTDVLGLLVQARYDNGEPIPDPHIAQDLVILVAAGHESTAATLAWAVERLRRHPRLLSRLTDEVDAGGSELRRATIWEVLRTRPVFPAAVRRTTARIQLGEWVIPEDTVVGANIQLVHASEESFPDAASFNPDRFAGTVPNHMAWIPWGGGMHRCIGAAFAEVEMDITLRTLLREFRFAPTGAPDERWHNRGVLIAPERGGRAVVYRRTADASSDADSVSVADYDNSRLGNR